MVHQNNLPANQGILYRPRVHALIDEGLQQPLLIMLAGPGYGKTQAMADYLAQSRTAALWLRLGPLDNLTSHFWDHLVSALQREYPAISGRLQALTFPDNLSSFGVFAKLLKSGVCGDRRIIWVFDDYGAIEEMQIKLFFWMLVEADLENFHVVLLSNVLKSDESVAFMTSKRFLILSDDLRFSQEEIAGLYSLHDIPLEPDALHAAERYTEGWPLPLHLLVLQRGTLPDLANSDERMTPRVISQLFEERFFSAYPRQQQALLIKLSLLESFTEVFVRDLSGGDASIAEALASHVFVISEPASDRFYFHHLYRLFLQKKSYMIPAEDMRAFWKSAAAHQRANGYAMEAVACFCQCADYDGMLEAISSFVKSDKEITETTAAYFLKHIDALTPAQVQAYPMADYLRARVYLSMLKLDEALALALNLEKQLLSSGIENTRELLIDVYAMLGNIHMMRQQEDFGDYYKKAADLLPAVPQGKRNSKLMTLNIHTFSMSDNQPGAKERMERAVQYAVPWMAKVLSGAMSGMEHIFSAEAAYLSGDMNGAAQHAYRGIYKAEANAQHDLVCNGFAILARIGFMRGDFAEVTKQIDSLTEYAGRYAIGVLREIRDTALGWYYVKMRDFKKIPKGILEITKTEMPVLSHGRPQIVHANYLINIGEYARLIGMLEHPKGLFLSHGIWPDRICLHIMLAIGHHHLGNAHAAIDALWTAYDMCYHNGLTTLFVEAETHMTALIEAARQQTRHAFDPQWLSNVYEQAEDFAKRAGAVRSAYRKQNPAKVPKDTPLTNREREVLQAISRGLTREEIAVEYYISVNTVKSTIRNIYNKLDAGNKAEAVSIAIARGYIEGYMPE